MFILETERLKLIPLDIHNLPSYRVLEKAGTGGALFRNLYREFLKESYQILKVEEINESYEMFVDIARMWRAVSKLFIKAGDEKEIQYIYKASEILVEIADKEKEAMNILLNACHDASCL